jgi:hypothetical protein
MSLELKELFKEGDKVLDFISVKNSDTPLPRKVNNEQLKFHQLTWYSNLNLNLQKYLMTQTSLTFLKLKKTIKLKPHIKFFLHNYTSHKKLPYTSTKLMNSKLCLQKPITQANIFNSFFYKNHQNFYSKFIPLVGNGVSEFFTDIKSNTLSPSLNNSFNSSDINVTRVRQKRKFLKTKNLFSTQKLFNTFVRKATMQAVIKRIRRSGYKSFNNKKNKQV